jgi:hypothetical protein
LVRQRAADSVEMAVAAEPALSARDEGLQDGLYPHGNRWRGERVHRRDHRGSEACPAGKSTGLTQAIHAHVWEKNGGHSSLRGPISSKTLAALVGRMR